MIKLLIALIRSIILSIVTCMVYLAWLTGSAFIRIFGSDRQKLRNSIFRFWARAATKIIGMQLSVHGSPPKGPFLMVSNHLSYVDIVAFASQSDCVFIAKREVSHWPVIGTFARSMGTIFIDRTNRNDIPRVLGLIERAFALGQSVILFAEGTSSPGETVLPFNSSLLEVATKAECPVFYASLGYETPQNQLPAHLSVCWWGDMTFLSHFFNLLKLPFFSATLVYGESPILTDNRKVLARELWKKVLGQFRPVVRPVIGMEQ